MGVPKAAFVIIVSVAVGIGLALGSQAVAQEAQPQPSYLFVFDGQKVVLKPATQSGTFSLTVPMKKSNHLVTWFTDRPNRDAGHMTLKDFVTMWQQPADDSFVTDPPNVAISFGNQSIIATMTDPRIVDTKAGGQALVSNLKLVQGEALTNLAKKSRNLGNHLKRAGKNDHRGAKNIARVSVFVDDMMKNPYSSFYCIGANQWYPPPGCLN